MQATMLVDRQPSHIQQLISWSLNANIGIAIENHEVLVKSKLQSRGLLGKLMVAQNDGSYETAKSLAMPDRKYSLSHCLNTVVAVANGLTNSMGIGVDLEYGRSLDPKSSKFYLTRRETEILNKQKMKNENSLLRLWTVKEAIYKADMENHFNFWFFDYEVNDPVTWMGVATKIMGSEKKIFRYASLPYKDGFITVAIAIRG